MNGDVLPTFEAEGAKIDVVLSDNRWPEGHRSDLWKRRGQETAEGPGVLRQARTAPL
jgi:hypothetical protein